MGASTKWNVFTAKLKSLTELEPVANALRTPMLSINANTVPPRRASALCTKHTNGARASPWLIYVCRTLNVDNTDCGTAHVSPQEFPVASSKIT
eukprot:12417639-Karenia_brevis.AAC.1